MSFQAQLERILNTLKPTTGHSQGPRKPSMSEQESTGAPKIFRITKAPTNV